jgi:hypothetical protein
LESEAISVFLFWRKNRIKVKVYYLGDDGYLADASFDDLAEYNCFGTTEEAARLMALTRLRQFQKEQAEQTSDS